MIVSRHHVWASPAGYAEQDGCLCMDCGQKRHVGKQDQKRLPRCYPKVEHPASGHRGWTLTRYMAACLRDPAKYPPPLCVFRV